MTKSICSLVVLTALPFMGATRLDNRIPLFFIANSGQAPAEVRFMAKGSGLTAFFLQEEVQFRTSAASVRMRMEGSVADARVEGADRLAGRVSFLTGAEENWRTGLPTYGAVAYRGLYHGIDMVYGGSGRNLKSEFVIAPGADPSQIRVRYVGAGPIRIDGAGALEIPVNGEILRERAPDVYQDRGGKRLVVKGGFSISRDGAIGFAIAEYDHALPLVIDPVISYSTYLGGSSTDAANAVTVDSTGAVYVAGFTASYNFPTLNPVQAANAGDNDVFVAKLNSAGNALVYATYLGGAGDDRAFGIAVDSNGAAYVTGWTQSSNFPVHNAMQASLAGGQNAFLVKLTAAGNGVAYSTYLGGNGSDSGNGIAVDSSFNAYVVGDTTSTNFPVSGFQAAYHGGQDAFVAKVNASGANLAYSTYLGGGNLDHGAAIALDSSGTAYITGSTTSTDFPVANAFQGTNGGGQNAFVTRLSATGSSLVFSTFLGGSGGRTGSPEAGQGIAVDSSGNAYVTGVTSSTNFPLLNPEQSTLNGSSDAFITKMNSAGALVYSTYLGGSGMDAANAIAVDSSRNVYVAGYTYSIDLPVVSALQATIGSVGSPDAFIGKLNAAGSALTFLTYLGGNDSDTATGLAVDVSGNIYAAGWTLSSNFPTVNAYQTSNAGNYGAFVTKYSFSVGPVNVSVAPNAGAGAVQTFSFEYSDSNGSSDLTAVGALFNTTPSLNSGCAVIYNPALNTLVLLTNAGAQPAGSIAPGNGTQQNSQCVLSGSGSSVSQSGNLLTLNLAIAFLGNFYGAKTVYMQSSNPFQITAWQSEGTWNVPASIALAVTPSSGNATQQTFSLLVTDPLGAVADLTSVGVLFNSSTSILAACSVNYNRAQNTLALTTDAGAQPASAITPGSGTQQNSQCVLNGAASSVSVAGNALTVNLAIAFQPAFGGTKNVYVDAASKNGPINWTQEGTWTSPPLVAMGVSPSSGSANQQTFSVQVTDSTGAADLTSIGVLWNATSSTTAACAVTYNPAQNALMLLTNTGALQAASITPGSGSQQNSQCVLNGIGSSVSSSGNTLTLLLAISFQPAFSGTKNIYTQAANPYETLNWQLEGTWTSPPVITMAVTPSSGSGSQQTFSVQITDSLSGSDLTTVGLLINSIAATSGGCSVTYSSANNTLALLTNTGAAPAATITPGSGSQQNSQCVLNGSGSSVSVSGTILTVNLALSFQPSFAGAKNVYTNAANPYETVGWQLEGVWAVPLPQVSSVAVAPSAGSAAQQTFSLQVSDPSGASDLTTVGLMFNSSISTVAGCVVLYNRSQNTLMLLTDSGAPPAASLSPGSGTQQNSQCILNGALSSASSGGNTLSVNIALAFEPGFAGVENLYAEAIGAAQSLTWQLEGVWAIPSAFVPSVAVTPSAGSATQQTFNLQVSDPSGASDLTTVGLMFNSTISTVAGCVVLYNRSQNTLMLLTDSGALAAASLSPGSGTQQNSQCILNGALSSASSGGNTLTVNIALAFQPGFGGVKNLYAEANGAAQSLTWQLEGFWDILSPQAPSMAVTPSAGSATQQTFNLQVSDSSGASDLTTVGLMFNSSISTVAGCVVLYNRSQNTFMLLTDSGASPAASISPGSGTQQNSQCMLKGALSSAVSGGTTLSVNLGLAFLPGFGGVKNLYAEAIGATQSLSWQQEGIWSLPTLNMGVTPSSGVSAQQTFSLQVTDSLGTADLTTIGILFNPSPSVVSGCAVTYNRAQNALTLMTDTGAAPAASIAPGSGTQQNSQCVLTGTGSSVSASGNTLTLNLAIAFLPAFSGPENLYLEAGSSFQAANWTLEGTWTSPPVVTLAVTPASGGGAAQVFAFQVADSIAATDLTTVGVLFNTSASVVNGCAVMYNRAQNALTLLTNAGAAPASSISPGSGSQQNSQCTLNGAGSTVTASGNTLTLNLSLSFPVTWVGTQTVYMEAVNPYQSGTWIAEGTWVTSASLTVSGTPISGSGAQTTFTIQANESSGASNVTAVGVLINSIVSLSAGCAVTYNLAQNLLTLLTDAGTAPASSITPGGGTQQNSQCLLNGAGSSVSAVGTVLTVNVAISFLAGFQGTKNVYVDGADPFHTIAWTLQGTWTVPQIAVPDLTVTSTHTGNFTQGQAGATYTIAAINGGNASTSGVVTVTETLPTGLTPKSMLGTNWTCTQPAGPCTRSDALAAGLSYNPITLTVNVSASAPASVINMATVSGGGETNTGNDQATDPTTITAVTATSTSIWPASAVPGTPWFSYSPYTLGVKFQSDLSGTITAIRFYKGAGNNGTHIGSLYDSNGNLLAQATFSGETASGWQQVNFATPVAIAANTVYVAAYFSTTGFAYDASYFATAGVNNPPLHALQNGVSGPNGVNVAGNAFPTTGYGANYWADVVFSALTGVPDLTITSSHPGSFTQAQNGAVYTVTATNSGTSATSGSVMVTETLPTGLTPISMLGTGWNCTQPAGPCVRSDALAAGLSYPPVTVTVNVSATAPASVINVATVSGGGETNTGNDQATDPTTITAVTATSTSIWPASAVPGTPWFSYSPYTLGVKFQSDLSGNITAVRFYKGAGNNGTHIGSLYDSNGNLLAQATFSGETASGWQQVNFATPVAIAANTVYVAAYFSTTGFAYDASYFATAGVNNPPLHALQNGVSGPNGVNVAGNAFPTTGYGANYWADVVFSAAGTFVTAPGIPDLTITSNHTGSFTQGQNGATYTVAATNSGTAATSGSVTVTETLPTGLTAVSMLGNNWNCTQPAGPCIRSDALAAGANYDPITVTVNVSAAAAASVINAVTVSGGGEINTANDLATDPTTIATASLTVGATASIWPPTAQPGTPFFSYTPCTLGVKFWSDVSGILTGVRYYKGLGNNGTHIGLLYTSGGTLLAQATFIGETASGWQQANFSTPVEIAANTVYVAAYFSTTGFAYDQTYLSGAGVYNPPLHAPQNGVLGPNGVYVEGTLPMFPTFGYGANYWADVVFSSAGIATGYPDLTITSSHIGAFTQGQNGASYTITATNSGTAATGGPVTVTDTLPAGLTPVSMLGNNWTCNQPDGPCMRSDPLEPGVSYDQLTVTANVSLTAPASVTNTVSVSGGGVSNSVQATDPTAIANAAASIWPATAVPGTPFYSDTPYTLGVKFQSDVSGTITAVRFYKGGGNNGTHIGLLYDSYGNLLAYATFSGETASGWQQVNFAAPVAIAANTVYVAAYFSTTGFAYDSTYFAGAGVNQPPLHALQNGVSGPNGVYAGGTAPQFPATGYGANYWADVVFSY